MKGRREQKCFHHLTRLAQGIGGNLRGHPVLKAVSSAYRETNPRPFLAAALAPGQSQLTSLLGSIKRKMNPQLKPAAPTPSSLLLPQGFRHMWEQGDGRICLCCCVAGRESPQTTHLDWTFVSLMLLSQLEKKGQEHWEEQPSKQWCSCQSPEQLLTTQPRHPGCLPLKSWSKLAQF